MVFWVEILDAMLDLLRQLETVALGLLHPPSGPHVDNAMMGSSRIQHFAVPLTLHGEGQGC